MKINKEFILKNIITICCLASLLLLLLPFVKLEMEVSSAFVDISSGTAASGFDAAFGENSVAVSWIMIVCPVVLILMNYIKQLDKYKSILAIVLPLISIIGAIITMSMLGSNATKASGIGGSVEVKVLPQIGFFLLVASYIGTLIAGAMTFYGLKLSKEGIVEFGNKIKQEGFSGIAQQESSQTAESASTYSSKPNNVKSAGKKTNVNQASEVLSLIKELSELKNQGILSEEEFDEKKKELLSQI